MGNFHLQVKEASIIVFGEAFNVLNDLTDLGDGENAVPCKI